MTGQVFTATPPPPHRVTMAYSIDSFSECSTAAVGRSPARAIVAPSAFVSFNSRMDEELFRDLFADADADAEDGADFVSPSKKSKSNVTPSKAIVWQTGASLAKPFATPPPSQPRPNQTPTGSSPSLSAPLPRQSAVDLMTARPHVTQVEEEQCTHVGLERVPEVNEEDDDDPPMTKLAMAKAISTGAVLSPVSPRFSLTSKGPRPVQHETLQFLEKLDLKLLLAQPRPDVTNFLPPSNQTHHIFHDSRIEEDSYGRPLLSGPSVPSRKPLSSRKEPLSALTEGSARLAHVAQTYGTTTGGPRKTRKETLKRLSNPISGHTSTLQALSPESRKKRELDLADWSPTKASVTPVKTLTSKKTRELIDRLSEAQHKRQAPSTSQVAQRKLVKGKKPSKATSMVRPALRSGSNQNDAEPTSRMSAAQPRLTTLDEQRVLLKHKLATSGSSYSGAAPASSGSTFLTQLEDINATPATHSVNFRRSNRKLIPQRRAEAKPTHDKLLHFPQPPIVPPSVRNREASSTTAALSSRNGKPSSHQQIAMRIKTSTCVKRNRGVGPAVSSLERARCRPSGSIGAGPAIMDRKQLASIKKKGATTTSTSNAPTGSIAANAPNTPLASATKSKARRLSVTKVQSRPEPGHGSLPLIRQPTPAAPQRPAPPASRRIHRIRTTK